MLHRDYLVRMLSEFALSIIRAIEREQDLSDPGKAAELLDMAIGEAVDIDAATFLSLSPDSIATIMQVSSTDPKVSEYIVRSLALAAAYYAEAGERQCADLRRAQAAAIARAYGHDIDDVLIADASADDPAHATEAMQDFLQQEAENGVGCGDDFELS